eukprot:1802112-Pyramimonas_sp.AAC.1
MEYVPCFSEEDFVFLICSLFLSCQTQQPCQKFQDSMHLARPVLVLELVAYPVQVLVVVALKFFHWPSVE